MKPLTKTGGNSAMILLQCVLIYFWLQILSGTDSYFSIYILCAIISVLCLCSNHTYPGKPEKKQNIILHIFSACFSVSVISANYSLFISPVPGFPGKKLSLLLAFSGGYMIGYSILTFLYNRLPFKKIQPRTGISRKKRFLFILGVFCLFCTIDLVYLFGAAYPGILTPDSIAQVSQIINGYTSNHHPFWHTVIISFFMHLGMNLFHDINAAVACYSVFSILFLASCFTYALYTLYRIGVPGPVLTLFIVFYSLAPYNITYSVTMWKDVPFAGAAVLLTVSLYRILSDTGHRHFSDYAAFISGSLGFCLWRTNGWFAYLFFAFIFAIYTVIRKKGFRLLITICSIILVSWILRGPVIKSLNIAQPDFVESLSIPIQQMARVLVNGDPVSEQERESLEDIFGNLSSVRNNYTPHNSDPLKALIRSHPDYLNRHKPQVLKFWIQLGLHHPAPYIKAWIDQTKGYWNGGYLYWIFEDHVWENNFQIYTHPLLPSNRILNNTNLITLLRSVLFEPLISIGLNVWLLSGLFISSLLHRRRQCLLCVPLIGILCTLLIAAPVFTEFRYIYSLFICMPFILSVHLYSPEKIKEGT